MSAEIHAIYGPPGTGKTTKLIEILKKELADGVLPTRIAYVSFTQEGAYQGKNRAKEEFPQYADKDFQYFRTLHSLAFSELKLKRNLVISKSHYKEFSRVMGMHFLGYYTEELHGRDDKYLFYDQLIKNNSKAAELYADDMDQDTLSFVRKNYRQFKTVHGIVDFTDMLEQFIEREQPIDVDVAFVDEAQDLTTLQWQMVWTAFARAKRIYIAGDDDQAIYQWAGADVEQFLGLHTTTRTILTQSYRLPDEILKFSKRITGHISQRIEKAYNGTGPGGRVARVLDFKDIRINPNETYMFLSRNRYFLTKMEEWIATQGMLYNILGKDAFLMEEYRLIFIYETNRKEDSRMLPPETIAELGSTLKEGWTVNDPWFDAFSWPLEKIAYYRDVIRSRPDVNNVKIRISTIHSVKGAEADNVILLPDITKRVRLNLDWNPDSEHRAFYVACTRAKKNLFVVDASSPHSYPLLEM